MPESDNFTYMFLNLVGEVGEFAGKIAKGIRKKEMTIHSDDLCTDGKLLTDDELKKEAGDILWQLSGLCGVMGWTLEDVAQMNLDKLSSRKQRNVIQGSGDNR